VGARIRLPLDGAIAVESVSLFQPAESYTSLAVPLIRATARMGPP
jgi:hypothetical protein